MAEGKTKKSFNQLNAELQEIVDWFEDADMDIDEAMLKYEQAMKLIEDIEKYLKTAENKIKKINARFSS